MKKLIQAIGGFMGVLLINLPLIMNAQVANRAVEKKINDQLVKVRQGKINIDEDSLVAIDPKAVLAALKKYKRDPSVNVRFAVQTAQYKISMHSIDTSIKRQVVESLIEDRRDADPLVSQQASKRLLSYKAIDFSPKAKQAIAADLGKKEVESGIILISGVAQVRTQVHRLKAIAANLDKTNSGWYNSRQWHARLALARMGDNQYLNTIIDMVESEPNDILRVTRLLGDIAYMRQPAGVELLKKYLNSEQRLPAVKSTVPGSTFSQYALDFLAQIIQDFPIQSKGIGYTGAEIAAARSWFRSHTTYTIIK
jgi:hypothetical protein